jgi:hypothetical protein
MLPSLLASVITGLHHLARRRGQSEGEYVVPVSTSDRTAQEKWEKLFFNHLSFMIFRADMDLAGDRARLVAGLRDQVLHNMKTGLPKDFASASMLARIAPLPLMRLLARIPMRGSFGTAYFTCIQESSFARESFLGCEVENLVHMPHVPPPPGFGVFLNGYGGRMNLVLSHLEGTFTREESDALLADIRGQLGDAQPAQL